MDDNRIQGDTYKSYAKEKRKAETEMDGQCKTGGRGQLDKIYKGSRIVYLSNIYYFDIIIILLTILLKYILTKNHDYWKKRNVPYLEPSLIFGNYKEAILLKKHQSQVTFDICSKFPNEPYIGTFFGTDPALVVLDPNLLKLILATDFYYFSGREVNDYSHKEVITRNVFFTGGDKWKIQRQNLTPLYSSSKIKGMFYLIQNCAKQLEELLEEETKYSQDVDAKVLLGKFTMDAITSCVFGINSDIMKKETSSTNPFSVLGSKIFDRSKIAGIKLYFRQMWPALFYALRLSIFDPSINDYFVRILKGVFESRSNAKSSRNDFVDLILTWKTGKVITSESMSNLKTGEKKTLTLEVNDELLASQCVALFGAGFETTSTVMSFTLYEIAKNPEVQKKVLEEVDLYFKRHNGEIEYECVNELPYLVACIEEAVRLYPGVPVNSREVMDDYTLPTGLRLKKGDRIHIPMNFIQRHPRYFSEPDKFNPERFYGDAKKNITPFTFSPFGEGPRICLGMRFARMPMHAGLLAVFRNHRVELSEDMPKTIPILPYSIVITPSIPIKLKFLPRKD
ncbi:cytochrome P450 6B5-like [Bicyclus anynana]|uniref:unspecific monooxygenase n=1 Tax=Bicyclus anynana TaxID=110368 RepID=A0A6J1MPZ7_BICAN|nr:cytochrome P450 6B5-like [Bicyclus anynana]